MLTPEIQRQLVDYLTQFIRIDSRSSAAGGCEGAVQRVVAGHMKRLGATTRMVLVDDLPGIREDPRFCGPKRQYDDRPTVIGEIGPADAPALLIMAHSDTVPLFAPDDWTHDPWVGDVVDGRIRGLGASDDKWGMAVTLMLLEAFNTPSLKKRLIFATTVDEESGVGNGLLILERAGVCAGAALYLDGNNMEINRGACGGSDYYLRPKKPLDDATLQRHEELLTAATKKKAREREPLFDCDGYRGSWPTTRSLLTYRRGAAENPFFLVAFYTLPGEEPQAWVEMLHNLAAEALGEDLNLYNTSVRKPWFEPVLVPEDEPIIQHLAMSGREVLGRDPVICTVSKNDAWVLTNHCNLPTVNFGPSARDLGRGAYHNPDEYLLEEELYTAWRIAHGTVARWLAS